MVTCNTTAVRNVATATVRHMLYETRFSLVETVTLRLVIIQPVHHKAVPQ